LGVDWGVDSTAAHGAKGVPDDYKPLPYQPVARW